MLSFLVRKSRPLYCWDPRVPVMCPLASYLISTNFDHEQLLWPTGNQDLPGVASIWPLTVVLQWMKWCIIWNTETKKERPPTPDRILLFFIHISCRSMKLLFTLSKGGFDGGRHPSSNCASAFKSLSFLFAGCNSRYYLSERYDSRVRLPSYRWTLSTMASESKIIANIQNAPPCLSQQDRAPLWSDGSAFSSIREATKQTTNDI